MPSPRPTPFDLVFGDSADKSFTEIRTALNRSGTDPRGRDAFLMVREVVALVRELRPEQGLGEGIDQLAALIHHSYLFWIAGRPSVELPAEHLADLLAASPPDIGRHEEPPAYYIQLPEQRIWADTGTGTPPEPLDGCFVHAAPHGQSLRVLGVFGLQRERAGFTVVEVAGIRPIALARPDGSALFSPTLPGGVAARLFSLVGGEELLELGWRLHERGAWSLELGASGQRLEPLADELTAPGDKLPAPRS
jgi:hypothetical protein